MKINYLYLIALLLTGLFLSCTDDENKAITNFEVPILTVDNSIQFTVTVESRMTFELFLRGNKLAVEWGDGKINKDMDPAGERTPWRHTFKSPGKYRVKIWTDELTFLNLQGVLQSFTELSIGVCPKLQYLYLNSIHDFTVFSGNNCPKLIDLNIGNMDALSTLDISQCPELEKLSCYTIPDIVSLDVSHNSNLIDLSVGGSGITILSTGNNTNLRGLTCADNKELENIDISGTPNISTFYIYRNNLSSIDLSNLTHLYELYCSKNQLTTLDLTTNKALRRLVCSDNIISTIVLDSGNQLEYVRVDGNKLDATALNNLFTILPESKYRIDSKVYMPVRPQVNMIVISGNPGTDTCDTSIILNKGWEIAEQP